MVVATAHGPPKPTLSLEAKRVFPSRDWAFGNLGRERGQFPKLIAALSEIEFL